MNFNSSPNTPHAITIDDTQYLLPRFLNRQFKEWVALRAAAQVERALEPYGDDADKKAKFLMYFGSGPPVDIADIATETTSPEGAEYVVLDCCKRATPPVPADLASALVENADPMELRALAKELASVKKAAEKIAEDAGKPDPDSRGASDPLK